MNKSTLEKRQFLLLIEELIVVKSKIITAYNKVQVAGRMEHQDARNLGKSTIALQGVIDALLYIMDEMEEK